MDEWKKITLILCMFGVLKEFRPSEPYIIQYLITPPMNFTMDEVFQEIFPFSVYAYLIELIIVFLVTDYLRYKLIIILHGITGFIVYVMLIFGRTVLAMQVMEVIYGIFMAGEVAYYTYIYAKVDKEHFQEVTSFTKTAYLIGRSFSGIVSQIVIGLKILDYYYLQWLTAGGLALATIWACFLPPVQNSIYFHKRKLSPTSTVASFNSDMNDISDQNSNKQNSRKKVFLVMFSDLKHAFMNKYVVKLIFWQVLATGGYFQIISYVQILWETIDMESAVKSGSVWNGGIETSYTLLGALATFGTSKLKLPWPKIGDHILSINSLIIAVTLFIMSQTKSIYIAYAMYIGGLVLFHATVTIVNSEIAQNLKEDSYGLIFGFLTFLSLIIQTVMTAVLVSKGGLELPSRLMYFIVGVFYASIGFVFTVKAVINTFCLCRSEDKNSVRL